MKYQILSREDWLLAAVAELRPVFKQRGFTLPEIIRVSVGFPGGRRLTSQAICWAGISGKDRGHELFVSPFLDDPTQVLGALAHNLVHAAVGVRAGHRAPFQNCAIAMGLEMPWVSTVGGSAFRIGVARPVLAAIGAPYPHSRLSAVDVNSSPKKQGTRLIKCACPTCGYTVRTSMKWIMTSTEPICPTPGCNKQPMECDV